MGRLGRRIARSPLARLAALPQRVRGVARHDARILRTSLAWLVRSREHTNYTYDLTDRNVHHLAWWVAGIVDRPVDEIRGYIREILQDEQLIGHIRRMTESSPRQRLADSDVRFGRRVGWYALARATRPNLVVETGTDKGLGSCVFAAALLRNGTGSLITVDINPDSGYLIGGPYAAVVERMIGPSTEMISTRIEGPVDLFLHDSWHTYDYETAELDAVRPKLAADALVLSDNAHDSDALLDWAEGSGRSFQFFREQPDGHWWPGEGIGIAVPRVHHRA